ncbi:hypothetical protein SELMODRAFT_430966 [Selaginella moellendorffii]|uniref:Uncharacterized protein n=1 Tax=Selaginella moellendorffii TaxID=88036 RepID=D8TB37_SELML|nr:hypothetical protein SELMODRAFT_430966 [Selaginella moellendorffii]
MEMLVILYWAAASAFVFRWLCRGVVTETEITRRCDAYISVKRPAVAQLAIDESGDRPMVGFGGGSKDIHRVANWMENSFPGGERNITPEHPVVLCGVGASILAARLTWLKLLKECKPGLVPRDWVFFQLEYPAVDDVFLRLVEEFLGLVCEVHQVPSFVNYFTRGIEKLVKELGWGDGTVVLDEAQSLLQCMKGRFISGQTPQEGQSLLNPIVLALKSYGALFVSDWFMEFAQKMITETGRELGVYRSLRDDVVLLWNDPEMASFIEDLIFTYYLLGAGHVIVPGWRRGMTLVDCGLATLLESSDGAEAFAPIVPYIRGVTDEAQVPSLPVTIETPSLSVTTEICYIIL